MPAFRLSTGIKKGFRGAFPAFDEPGLRTYFADDTHCLVYGDTARFDPRQAGERAAIDGLSQIVQCQHTGAIDIIADRSSAYPLYVAIRGERVLITSDVPHLLNILDPEDRRPDRQALDELLAFGQILGQRTTLEDVVHLAGDTGLRIDENGCHRIDENYARTVGHRENVNQVIDRLVAVVSRQARQVEDDLLLPISGGLDTRLILAACLAAGLRPGLCVFGAPDSADRTIADAIARTHKLPLAAFDIDPEMAWARAPMVALASGGELPLHHGHALLASGFAEAIDGQAMMVGTGGEAFRAFYYDRGMPGFSHLGQGALKPALTKRAKRWVSEHVLDHADDIPADLLERLDGEIGSILDNEPDLARGLDQVYLQMRVRRAVIAGQQILNDHCLRLHPLLDTGLQAAFASLPIGWRLGGAFHRHAIHQLSPALADITWDRTSRPLSKGLTWQERWPGLANRLGARGAYAKAGAPLGDYRGLLSNTGLKEMITELDDSGLLSDASRAMLRRPTPGRIGALKSFACWASSLQRTKTDQLNERIPA
ncbi:MAG: hypothetical protein ACR2RF_04865 [Geminicoccaceae bacterium]